MLKDRLRKIPLFFNLVRWPNLLIIIVVQLALYYIIIGNLYHMAGINRAMSRIDLIILIFTTVLIAAAGYIINDYFDLQTDRINKPDSMILGKKLDHRLGIILHLAFNGIAFITGFYIAFKAGSWRLGLIFPLMIMLLWLYSVRYKKTIIWGNIAVAFMTAMVIIIVWLFEFFMLRQKPDDFVMLAPYLGTITRYFAIFALFAFLLTLIREIIKDAEDFEGDKVAGFHTLAVDSGIKASKKWAIGVSICTALMLCYVVYAFINEGMPFAGIWYGATVILPLIWLMFKMVKASNKSDFHLISNMIKIVMAAGIIGLQPIAISLT